MEEKGKILIIDDNEDVLFALNLLLEPYMEQIRVTTQPTRIEHFMTTFHPDVILLDMNFQRDAISGQEGFDYLKQILRIDPQAVVVFMTAYADTGKAVQAIKAGATDFISKPWEKEKLLATLSAAVKLSRSRQEVGRLQNEVQALKGDDRIPELIGKTHITRILANGSKAYDAYMRHIYKPGMLIPVKLPSTSPANAAWTLGKLIEAWKPELCKKNAADDILSL